MKLLIQQGEGALVDFKQQWYDLQHHDSKCELAKDIIAMANSATPDQPGAILIGVDDAGSAIGVTVSPTEERVNNIVVAYTNPPVPVEVYQIVVSGVPVDVIEIPYSSLRPFHAAQDGRTCKEHMAYIRRGSTTTVMTPQESERMFREKDAIARSPILMGFSAPMNWASGILRVTVRNRTAVSIAGVTVVVEIASTVYPESKCRQRSLSDVILAPKESREFDLNIIELMPLKIGQESRNPWTNLRHRWLDITLHLTFRDGDGLVRSASETMHLGD